MNGLWYERLYRNSDYTIKWNYKKGLKNGEWQEGWYDSSPFVLTKIESFKNGLLDVPIIFYTFLGAVENGDVYKEIQFKKGAKVNAAKFYSLDGTPKNGIETNTNILTYKFSNPITEKILLKKE